MELTKEALFKLFEEEIDEAYRRHPGRGNLAKWAHKRTKKVIIRREKESQPMPKTTPEEDERAKLDFRQRLQVNLIKNMVIKAGLEFFDLTPEIEDALKVNDDGKKLIAKIKINTILKCIYIPKK